MNRWTIGAVTITRVVERETLRSSRQPQQSALPADDAFVNLCLGNDTAGSNP